MTALPMFGSWSKLASLSSPVAQLVEQAAVNRRVVGSSPTGGASGFFSQAEATRNNAQDYRIGFRAFCVSWPNLAGFADSLNPISETLSILRSI